MPIVDEVSSSSGPSVPVRSSLEFMETTWSGPVLPLPGLADGDPASHTSSPDADLIRLCAEHPGYMTAVKENPDEEEDGPAWQAYERNRDAISAASPKTLAGMIAKARAAKLEATFWDTSENVHGTMGEPWAWDLVNSLLRLAGEG